MYPDIEKLKKAGYEVKEMSPWHYHVVGAVTINVWPSRKKYMLQYGSGASYYDDIMVVAANILGDPKTKIRNPRWLLDRLIAERDRYVTDEDRAAVVLWRKDLSTHFGFLLDLRRQLEGV